MTGSAHFSLRKADSLRATCRRVVAAIVVLGVAALPVIGDCAEAKLQAIQQVERGDTAANEAASAAMTLGVGDVLDIQVYGRPELSTKTYVAEDGSVQMPLAGAIQIAGLSPAQASQKLADALRKGDFVLRPQVSIQLSQFHSQQVSVLGEVRTAGRFPIESRTTVFDLLALAGGVTAAGADEIVLLRPHGEGQVTRYPLDLKSLTDEHKPVPTLALRGGDTLFVPRAEQFYIYGEVTAPNMYRIEPGMTVVQAISRGGGITARGSDSRIEIVRRTSDQKYLHLQPSLLDPVMPNDVIRVKERLF